LSSQSQRNVFYKRDVYKPGPADRQSTVKFVLTKVLTFFSTPGPYTFTLPGLVGCDTFTWNKQFHIISQTQQH